MKLELETYMPSEAEDITKVTQATVRNWRRAGYLPRPAGHARYTIADILVMTAMQALVSRGVTPDVAKGFAGEVARAAFQNLINTPSTYSPDVVASALAEIGATEPDDVVKFNAGRGAEFGVEATTDQLNEIRSQEAAMNAAARTFGVAGLKTPEWLIIWANGEMQFYYDDDIKEETFFGNTVYNEFVQGPVILFCLGAIAKMVRDRLPRPAIKLAKGR